MCSKYEPFCRTHNSHRRLKDPTAAAKFRFLNSSQAYWMRSISSSLEFTGVAYTISFKTPQTKKSQGVISGLRGGQLTGPLRPIHLSGKLLSNQFLTFLWKWAGQPSSWNQAANLDSSGIFSHILACSSIRNCKKNSPLTCSGKK